MTSSTTFNTASPVFQANSVQAGSSSQQAPKLIVETATEGDFESFDICGDTLFRGYSKRETVKSGDHHAITYRYYLTAYNADDLTAGRTYEGPDGHDDISLYFEDKNYIASISTCGVGATSYVWNKNSGELIAKVNSSASFAHKDNSLVVQVYVEKNKGEWEILPVLWDLSKGSSVGVLENGVWLKSDPKIEGDLIYGALEKGVIGCWNRFTGAFVKKIGEERQNARIQTLFVNPDNIIAVEIDTIRIFDTKTGACIKSIPKPGATPSDPVAFHEHVSINGDLLLLRSYLKMHLWNIKEERVVYAVIGDRWLTTDSDSHIFANERGEIEVRDIFDGKLKATLQGHPNQRAVDIVCKSAEKYLVSASKDGLKVWDKGQGTLVAVLSEEPVKGIEVKNRQLFAQVGNTLKTWDLSTLG